MMTTLAPIHLSASENHSSPKGWTDFTANPSLLTETKNNADSLPANMRIEESELVLCQNLAICDLGGISYLNPCLRFNNYMPK
eukprot:c47721_g1_i1 orf=897-1145(+)